jgi:hypothetical protein
VRRADPETRALWKSLIRRPLVTLFPPRPEVSEK